MWDYVFWAIVIVAVLYILVRIALAVFFRKDRYKG